VDSARAVGCRRGMTARRVARCLQPLPAGRPARAVVDGGQMLPVGVGGDSPGAEAIKRPRDQGRIGHRRAGARRDRGGGCCAVGCGTPSGRFGTGSGVGNGSAMTRREGWSAANMRAGLRESSRSARGTRTLPGMAPRETRERRSWRHASARARALRLRGRSRDSCGCPSPVCRRVTPPVRGPTPSRWDRTTATGRRRRRYRRCWSKNASSCGPSSPRTCRRCFAQRSK
jgi:hypothetical protein